LAEPIDNIIKIHGKASLIHVCSVIQRVVQAKDLLKFIEQLLTTKETNE